MASYPISDHRKPLQIFVCIFQVLCAPMLGFGIWFHQYTSYIVHGPLIILPIVLACVATAIWFFSTIAAIRCPSSCFVPRFNLLGFFLLVAALISYPIILYHGRRYVDRNIYDFSNLLATVGDPLGWGFFATQLNSSVLLLIDYFIVTVERKSTQPPTLPESSRNFIGVLISLAHFDIFITTCCTYSFFLVPAAVNLIWIVGVVAILHLVLTLITLYKMFNGTAKYFMGFHSIATLLSVIIDIGVPILTIVLLLTGSTLRIRSKRDVQHTYSFDYSIVIIILAIVCGFALFQLARIILGIISFVQSRRIKKELENEPLIEELGLLNSQDQDVSPIDTVVVPVYIPIQVSFAN